MTQTLFYQLCWIWIAIPIILFPILLNIAQPYGKHCKRSWGPLINNRLGWFLMELPALAIFLLLFLTNPVFNSSYILFAAALWCLHYFNRTFIYPLRIHTKGKKIPLIIVLFAVIFNSFNGFLNSYALIHFSTELSFEFVSSSRVIVGCCIFTTGFLINQYHDHLLIKLRKSNGTGYKIPYGGLFKFISCPNFLGEIITWLGFYILVFNLPALSFFVWTMVNLIPRALDHHKWYRKEFNNYPKQRKAIIPKIL